MKEIKKKLFEACEKYVEDKIAVARKAMDDAQLSANQETKSSAGDKHETGRAMAQLEQEKNAKKLAEVLEVKRGLEMLRTQNTGEKIEFGSLVYTNVGVYYISISIGKIEVEGTSFFAVSPASPIAVALKGNKAGDEITFNGRKFQIKEVQ